MIDELGRHLEEPGEFVASAPARLREIAAQLPDLAESIMESPQRSADAASGSYDHPNGFEKLLLTTTCGAWKYLLHTWTPQSLEQAVAAEHSHNHRWPFATLVLRGAYRFETFQVTASTTGAGFLYRYMSAGADRHYRLLEMGRAQLSAALAFDLRAGCVCVSDSATVHRVVPLETPVMTLFVQGPPDRAETMVVSDKPASRTGEVSINRFSISEWRARLSKRIEQLRDHALTAPH